MHPLTVVYLWPLVATSILLSILAAYAAFGLSDRMLLATSRPHRLYWLGGGAIAMGTGIWSMHYLGMLAVRLPVPVDYFVPTVAGSLLLAIAASAVALTVVSAEDSGWKNTLVGGLLMGAGIGGMHYSGMAAMRTSAMHVYSPSLVALSLLTAVGVSIVSLRVAHLARAVGPAQKLSRAAAAVLMGLGIASTHYISMSAVRFFPGTMAYSTAYIVRFETPGVVALGLTTTVLLLIALLTSAMEKSKYLRLHLAHAELAASQAAFIESEARLQEVNSALNALSFRDGLTGLYNRRHFDTALKAEWHRAVRTHQPLALLLIDIDYFKQVNDLYGHLYGDECLRQLSRIFEGQPRRVEDMVARLGGEEFAVLLPGSELNHACTIANTIQKSIRALAFGNGPMAGRPVTVSIGVGSCRPRMEDKFEQMFANTDEALYEAKRAGRDQIWIGTFKEANNPVEPVRL